MYNNSAGDGVRGLYIFSASTASYDANGLLSLAFRNVNISGANSGGGWSSADTGSAGYTTIRPYSTLGVFNFTITTTYDGSNTVNGEWIQVQLPISIKLTQYNFAAIHFTNESRIPSRWILLGSNNGSTWNTIDNKLTSDYTYATLTNNTNNLVSVPVSGVTNSYNYYRMVINKLNPVNGGPVVFMSHFNVIGNYTF